ncbi:MAG: 1-(5-phosphoribosyl)-5-[(5-phosphoribosylamino)methylideneamino]imidazole-4-carboxamide isomerase [bacterium]|nr:1-(5-phosphoribosyl)-5-[(5-phosphoribosylamino)methylideneamino]imidazole-4-carboxamide isomerase [bacterium]
MLVIPAIDIREGKVVRLKKGEFSEQTTYLDEPVSVALKWQEEGARMIHVVDLDGAFFGLPQNLEVIEEICSNVSIPIQMGGGLRNLELIEKVIDFGVQRVVLGSAAIIKPEILKEALFRFSAKRVVVGIDIKEGKIAISGWQKVSDYKVDEFIMGLRKIGLAEIIVTDIERDGMLSGPNIPLLEELAKKTMGLRIIASGGVSCLPDIIALKRLTEYGVYGVIIGKSLYDGKITLKEALEVAKW